MNSQLPIISQAPLQTRRTYPANHLQTLLDGFCDLSGVENAGLTFKGLSLNSKKVHEDFLFLACAGVGNTSHHGIAYAGEAINKGASCIAWEPANELQEMPQSCTVAGKNDVPLIRVESLLEKSGEIAARFYQHPSRDMRIIGITGTNGKTSCTHFIAQLIRIMAKSLPENNTCALIGTLGNGRIGKLQQSSHTTPDAVTLQGLMAEYREQLVNTVVMEVSSHALAQGRVNGIEFDVAVLTNLSRDHLDFHGDMQSYANEKLKLFLNPQLKNIILNKDDVFSAQIIKQLHKASSVGQKQEPQPTLLTYARKDQKADFYASDVRLNETGIEFKLHRSGNVYAVNSVLIGDFNIDNLLAAIAVLEQQGYELSMIIKAVKKLTTVSGRMEKIVLQTSAKQQPLLVVDYAHTPDALVKALQAMRAHTRGKLWCVFGCGGDRDQGKRALMAEAVEQYADEMIVTSDNPRSESPQKIIEDILSGFKVPHKVRVEIDRSKAIEQALNLLENNDALLIAGKGHENYQEIKGQKIPFSDKNCIEHFYKAGRNAGASL